MPLTALVLVAMLGVALPVFGQTTRYVSDHITVLLRSGPSLENRIVQSLSAGDKLVVLSRNEDSGYAHVRVVGNGKEGWLLTRFLMSRPSARSQLNAMQERLGDARSRVDSLQTQVTTLQQKVQRTQAKLETTMATARKATNQLQKIRAVSANAIQLRNANQQLKGRVADFQERINRLAMEKKQVVSQQRQRWFLVGGAVLFGGILIGLIAPHTKRKRRGRW